MKIACACVSEFYMDIYGISRDNVCRSGTYQMVLVVYRSISWQRLDFAKDEPQSWLLFAAVIVSDETFRG